MTQNIKANNYSITNPKSNLWAIQTNYDALLKLLMSNVIENILVAGDPNTMTVNGIKSTAATDSSFVFANKFPLSGVNTPFNTEIRYRFTNPVDNTTRDTSVTLNFVVRRSNKAILPAGISTKCWEQPTLKFYYNGISISEATEDMELIQVRLTPNDEKITYAPVSLKSSLETMSVNLTQIGGTYWEKAFTRKTGTSSVNDNILQHISGDSIIAVYRNPLLILDTVRVAIPVRSHPAGIPVTAVLRDTSGDGHIDRIDLTWTADIVSLITLLPTVEKFLTNAKITSADGSSIQLIPNSLIKKGDKSLSIILNENNGTKLETGWNNATITLSAITMTLQGNSFFVDKITDGAGPVIDRVIYYPGSKDRDTLKILLSEPVECGVLTGGIPKNAFLYIKNGSLATELLSDASYAANCISGYITEVTVVLKSGVVTPLKDSLSLIGSSQYVKDKYGNNPSVKNKRTKIEWGVQNEIVLSISNNPFIPGVTDISEEIRRDFPNTLNGKSHGVLISVFSIKSLDKTSGGDYGKAIIYDALGNLVGKSFSVIGESVNNSYGIYWDGFNRNNRAVGSGVYLIVISVVSDGEKYTQKIKVGVKK